MSKTIVLDVSHPDSTAGKIEGFQFFWAHYVKGFDSRVHCQDCLIGQTASEFNSRTAAVGKPVALGKMDQYPYVYVCGVALGDRTELYRKNFHLPLRYQEGKSVSAITFNGYIVSAQNAVLLPIPSLPKNWPPNGEVLPDSTTRCKNFQFGVEYFGYPSPAVAEVRATPRG